MAPPLVCLIVFRASLESIKTKKDKRCVNHVYQIQSVQVPAQSHVTHAELEKVQQTKEVPFVKIVNLAVLVRHVKSVQ